MTANAVVIEFATVDVAVGGAAATVTLDAAPIEVGLDSSTVEVTLGGSTEVTVSNPTIELTVGAPGAVEIVSLGVPGPQGPPGPAGASTFTAMAAVTVSGHRCVAWRADGQVEYASNTTPAHAWAAVGITTGAAIAGDLATVHGFGRLDEGSWSWTPLTLIYLGVGGLLTQTPPVAPAFVRVLGHAITPTSMWVSPRQPIIQI
ncbi:MAG: hypothetical protein ACKV2O_14740 [Acidimicrobiales bacterium]